MAGFRCIQVFLFVILLLEFPAANGDMLYIYGRDGDGVTLPCTNVRKDQNQCNGTTWIINNYRRKEVTELIKLGKINEDVQDESDRLNITEDCSLVYNKVKVEDVGFYHCRQYDDSGVQRGLSSQVELSVVSLTERQDGDDVTLICSVSTRGGCFSPVTWMFHGVEIEKDHPDITISKSSCSATVTYNRGKHFLTTTAQVFKCRVHHGNEIKEFPFTRSSSEKQPDDDGRKNKNTGVTSTPSGKADLWWIALVAVVFVVLIVTVVVFIRWRKHKGKERQTNGYALTSTPAMMQLAPESSHDLADPEDVVPYASISYTKKASSEARVLSKDDDDTVTYSAVKASPSSTAASTDHSSLYATVNKN